MRVEPELYLFIYHSLKLNSVSTLYSLHDLISVVNEYVADKKIANPNDPQFVDIDPLLRSTFTSSKSTTEDPPINRLRRDELAKKISEKMQDWYQIQTPDEKDPVVKRVSFPLPKQNNLKKIAHYLF